MRMKQVPDESDVWEDEDGAYAVVPVKQIGPPMRMEEDGMERVGGKSPSSEECDSLSLSERDGGRARSEAHIVV